MNIIIIGSGAVGAAICSQLAKEHHAITVIDSNLEAITEISNTCDVTGLLGNGAELSVLREAGAERADLLIAVTNSDEINILCCYAAKKLGTANTIARVRNPEYAEFMELMQSDMNLSLTINPEHAAASEIFRLLRFPSATKLDTFCDGRVDVAEFTVPKDSSFCGISLYALRERLGIKFLVCSVKRGEEVYIPSGDFVLEAADVICVTASEEEITKFFKASGSYKSPIRELLIAGGGRTTYYLGELLKEKKMNVVAIESSKARAEELASEFPWTVIHGDGTNQELLLEEGIENADAFLALTDVDEENAIVSMYAKTKGVPKVITMISSLPYIDFFRGVGVESIVSPKSATVGQILRFVRSLAASHDSEIESLHRMMDDRIEALEFTVKENIQGLTDTPLKNLKKKSNCIIACILHGTDIIIPAGNDVIQKGDRVIVMNRDGKMNSIKDIII